MKNTMEEATMRTEGPCEIYLIGIGIKMVFEEVESFL